MIYSVSVMLLFKGQQKAFPVWGRKLIIMMKTHAKTGKIADLTDAGRTGGRNTLNETGICSTNEQHIIKMILIQGKNGQFRQFVHLLG